MNNPNATREEVLALLKTSTTCQVYTYLDDKFKYDLTIAKEVLTYSQNYYLMLPIEFQENTEILLGLFKTDMKDHLRYFIYAVIQRSPTLRANKPFIMNVLREKYGMIFLFIDEKLRSDVDILDAFVNVSTDTSRFNAYRKYLKNEVVEKIVEKEVIKEVEVEKIVEVHIETIVEKEVVREQTIFEFMTSSAGAVACNATWYSNMGHAIEYSSKLTGLTNTPTRNCTRDFIMQTLKYLYNDKIDETLTLINHVNIHNLIKQHALVKASKLCKFILEESSKLEKDEMIRIIGMMQ